MSDGSVALYAFQKNLLRQQTLPAPDNYSLLLEPTIRSRTHVLPVDEDTTDTLSGPQKGYVLGKDIVDGPYTCARMRFAQYEQRRSVLTNKGREIQDDLMNYALLNVDSVKLITDRLEGRCLTIPIVPEPIRRKQPNRDSFRPLSRIDRIKQYKENISQHIPPEEPPSKLSIDSAPRLYESCDIIKNTNIINLHLVGG